MLITHAIKIAWISKWELAIKLLDDSNLSLNLSFLRMCYCLFHSQNVGKFCFSEWKGAEITGVTVGISFLLVMVALLYLSYRLRLCYFFNLSFQKANLEFNQNKALGFCSAALLIKLLNNSKLPK